MRAIFKAVGGKHYLASKLQNHLPLKWTSMTENFARGYSLTMSMPYSGRFERWNDLDPALFDLMRDIVQYTDAFVVRARELPYTRETFEAAKIKKDRTTLDTFVVLNMSRGGMGEDFSWSNRTRGGEPGDEHAWNTRLDALPLAATRLKSIAILNWCGLDLASWLADDQLAFQYWDPPYFPDSRTSKRVYGKYEMTREQHGQLAEIAKASKGPIMISGYDCPEYRDWYRGWTQITFNMPNHAGQGGTKNRRIESIWKNY